MYRAATVETVAVVFDEAARQSEPRLGSGSLYPYLTIDAQCKTTPNYFYWRDPSYCPTSRSGVNNANVHTQQSDGPELQFDIQFKIQHP